MEPLLAAGSQDRRRKEIHARHHPRHLRRTVGLECLGEGGIEPRADGQRAAGRRTVPEVVRPPVRGELRVVDRMRQHAAERGSIGSRQLNAELQRRAGGDQWSGRRAVDPGIAGQIGRDVGDSVDVHGSARLPVRPVAVPRLDADGGVRRRQAVNDVHTFGDPGAPERGRGVSGREDLERARGIDGECVDSVDFLAAAEISLTPDARVTEGELAVSTDRQRARDRDKFRLVPGAARQGGCDRCDGQRRDEVRSENDPGSPHHRAECN
jgi:hypothetical protein